MTSITFHGGINEIGGNKFLLGDKDTKIFLDFGMSFTKYGKFYEELSQPLTPPFSLCKFNVNQFLSQLHIFRLITCDISS